MSTPIPYLSQQPVDDFGLLFSNLSYSVTLNVATDTVLVVPSVASRFKAVIRTRAGSVVWVALNNIATLPAGNTFAPTKSEIINVTGLCREVRAGDVLHFITNDPSMDVSVAFYAIGTNN